MEKKHRQILLFAGMGALLAAALGYTLLAGNAPQGQAGGQAGNGAAVLPSSGTQTQIDLTPSGGTVTGPGAEISGGRVIIRQAGEYRIAGTFRGQIYVEAGSGDTVALRLAGAEITNDADAALHVENAGTTVGGGAGDGPGRQCQRRGGLCPGRPHPGRGGVAAGAGVPQ